MSTRTTRRDFVDLEKRRRKGMALLAKGVPQAEVARLCGVTRTSVFRWKEHREDLGKDAWKRGRMGRPPKLTTTHIKQVEKALVQGAQAHGYLNDLWTLPRIAAVTERLCGVRCHPAHLWKVLGRLGWSCQRPSGKAAERDESAIAQWKRHTWPALKKRPAKSAEPSFS
jgi:transposase